MFFFGNYSGYREAVSVTPLFEQVLESRRNQGRFLRTACSCADWAINSTTRPAKPPNYSRQSCHLFLALRFPMTISPTCPVGWLAFHPLSTAMQSFGMTQLAGLANQSTPIGSNNILLTTNTGKQQLVHGWGILILISAIVTKFPSSTARVLPPQPDCPVTQTSKPLRLIPIRIQV